MSRPIPFYGVPKILHTDQGSANCPHLFGWLLQALDVMPGNSRATSGTESTQSNVTDNLDQPL